MKLVSRSKKIQQQLVKPINSKKKKKKKKKKREKKKKKKTGKDIENIHTEFFKT